MFAFEDPLVPLDESIHLNESRDEKGRRPEPLTWSFNESISARISSFVSAASPAYLNKTGLIPMSPSKTHWKRKKNTYFPFTSNYIGRSLHLSGVHPTLLSPIPSSFGNVSLIWSTVLPSTTLLHNDFSTLPVLSAPFSSFITSPSPPKLCFPFSFYRNPFALLAPPFLIQSHPPPLDFLSPLT